MFELYNIANARDFSQLDKEVTQGKLSKKEFVARVIEIESRAAEKTRAFYIHVFLPWAKEHRISTNPEIWFLGCRTNVGQNLVVSFMSKNDAYYRHYEDHYDLIRDGSRGLQ